MIPNRFVKAVYRSKIKNMVAASFSLAGYELLQ